jgi:hypothetical protein
VTNIPIVGIIGPRPVPHFNSAPKRYTGTGGPGRLLKAKLGPPGMRLPRTRIFDALSIKVKMALVMWGPMASAMSFARDGPIASSRFLPAVVD